MHTELLKPNQKNRVTIVLRRFEEDLREALRWLDGYTEEGYLYHRKLEMSEEKMALVRKLIQDALVDIASLVEQLDLNVEEENAVRMIRGTMSVDWADLSILHARDLRGAGEVNPDLAAILDRPVDRLANTALRIANKLFEND